MAVTGTPLVNGTAYTHADIVLNVLGTPIIEVTEISYSSLQDIEKNFGTGNQATSRSFGQINHEGSITIAMKEYNKIVALAPLGQIQNIPDFPIGVNYSPEGQDFRRDALSLCRFKGTDISSSQGDTNVYVTLELSVGDIAYGV
jgi:hypothetical protein